MNISEETLIHVAKLARLAISEDELHTFAPQLNDILGYAEQLQAVDMTDIEPTSHAFPLYNVLREDKAQSGISRAAALANAPDTDGEQVRVPAVLEGS